MNWSQCYSNAIVTSFVHKLIPDFYVMVSKSTMEDGSEWIHISVSRRDRIPSWEEMIKVKDEFLGDFAEAYHIIPKKSEYINLAKTCLHMWSPLSRGNELPNLHKIRNEVQCFCHETHRKNVETIFQY